LPGISPVSLVAQKSFLVSNKMGLTRLAGSCGQHGARCQLAGPEAGFLAGRELSPRPISNKTRAHSMAGGWPEGSPGTGAQERAAAVGIAGAAAGPVSAPRPRRLPGRASSRRRTMHYSRRSSPRRGARGWRRLRYFAGARKIPGPAPELESSRVINPAAPGAGSVGHPRGPVAACSRRSRAD